MGLTTLHPAPIRNAFRFLVGNRIEVFNGARAGKKRPCVMGRFTPSPALMLERCGHLNLPSEAMETAMEPVTVFLRKPPQADRYADAVYRLHAEEKLSFGVIPKKLGIGEGVAYHAWLRWHEIRGLPVPDESHLRQGRPKKMVSGG